MVPSSIPSVGWLRCATAAMLIASALPAFASLGGNAASVEADRARMSASINVTQSGNYTVHEIQSPAGTVVDEYISPAGQVFAVTWRCQFMPQMQQLLGNHFAEYAEALQAQPHHYGRRPLNIQRPDLVVQTGGHMRDHFGRAYLPGMLPKGVSADAIR